jgi:hypothetical protein
MKYFPFAVLLGSLMLIVGGFAALRALTPLIPCTDHTAQSLALALLVGIIFQLFAGTRLRGGWLRWTLSVEAVLLLIVAWLGFYPISPLPIPTFQGFSILTQVRGRVTILPGGMVTLASGSLAAIHPLTLTGEAHCRWISSFGGALDDPGSCDVVYVPPQREYDILKLSLEPGCGLPRSVEQLKISILP